MGLRYEDEDYVRVYTRDTTTWKMLSWEARALWLLLMRKLDRIGNVDTGKHAERGLAALVDVPVEVVERALPELIDAEVIARTATGYCSPNFLEAQSAVVPPNVRKKVYRERRRLKARQEALEREGYAKGTLEVREGDAKGTKGDTNPTLPNATLPNATLPNATLPTRARSSCGGLAATPGSGNAKGTLENSPSSERSSETRSDAQQTSLGSDVPPKAENERVAPENKRRSKSRPKPEPHPGFRAFVDGFTVLFRENRGGAKPSWGAKQGKWVNDILARTEGDVTLALDRARRMFDLAPKWPAENPDLATLYSNWDKFAPPVRASGATAGHAKAMNFEDYPEPGAKDW